ncbi:hypothetical protein OC842_005725 [Tilletia horrida]|uniref:Uncharacterized protein n=1 Tax=Tilletia horrida TaxID=155126 RepID=A0AAN6G7A6_9BASI|nr:hypothetical protein OC842_005725 [Tilletia horrida]
MNDPNPYNSYCEAIFQIPVLTIDERGKDGHVDISTDVILASSRLERCRATGWWRGDRPTVNHMLAGPFQLAIVDMLVLIFDKNCLEVRSGSPYDSDYFATHMEGLSLAVRVFGKVVSSTDRSFTVLYSTRMPDQHPTDKSGVLTHIQIDIPDDWDTVANPIPSVGTFSGGRAIINDVETTGSDRRLIATAEHIQKPVFHAAVVANGTPHHQKFADAYAKHKAGVSSSAVVVKPKKAPITVDHTTTFCEITHRFMVVDVADDDPKALMVRFLTTEAQACDFATYWPLDDVPPMHAIFTGHGFVGLQLDHLVLVLTPASIEVRHGNPADFRYRQKHAPKGKPQLRIAGLCYESAGRSSSLEARVRANGLEIAVRVRLVLPESKADNKRWGSTKPFDTGRIVSLRGSIRNVVFGEQAMITVDPESLQNAAPGAPEPEVGLKASSSPSLGWDSPARRPAASVMSTRYATAGIGPSSPSSSSAITDEGINSPSGGKTIVNGIHPYASSPPHPTVTGAARMTHPFSWSGSLSTPSVTSPPPNGVAMSPAESASSSQSGQTNLSALMTPSPSQQQSQRRSASEVGDGDVRPPKRQQRLPRAQKGSSPSR